MDKGRGTPLWSVIIVLALWTAIRVAHYEYWQRQLNIEAIKYGVANTAKNPRDITVILRANDTLLSNSTFQKPALVVSTLSAFRTILGDKRRVNGKGPYGSAVKISILSPNIAVNQLYPETIIWTSAPQQHLASGLTPVTTKVTKFKMAIYGYSFWRGGAHSDGLAPAGQYGGSQSGIIATYLLGDTITKPALLLRTSLAPGGKRDREFAIGARIRPFSSVPVTLSAERRFRSNAQDNFAVYLAGGKSDVRLPAEFFLNGYAQAGIVRTKSLEHFFDGNLHVDHKLVQNKIAALQIGAGLWAGGQKGIARIDVGPSIRSDVNLGSARLRIDADWRFRLAGNARPGNGPALTISTSF
jgi:hypothetical protein